MNEHTTAMPELVVGVDGSTQALGALREGLSLAKALGYRVRVICAWSWPIGQGVVMSPPVIWDPIDDAREILRSAVAAVEIPAGVEVTWQVRQGEAADVLIAASREAQLIVTGSTGLGRAQRLFLGSVSTKVTQRAACPVLVYRAMPTGGLTDAAPTAKAEMGGELAGAR